MEYGESLEDQPIRFGLGAEGKIVRAGFLQEMLQGEEPEILELSNVWDRHQAIRDKLVEELDELRVAGSHSDMLDEAADFMSAATEFHKTVPATPEDSELFGRYQDLIHRRGLSFHDIEVRRAERDTVNGPLVVGCLVKSVLIAPDSPFRQYYLDHPDRFPRLD